VKNNILKAEKLSDEKFFANDLKNNIHRSDFSYVEKLLYCLLSLKWLTFGLN